MKHHPQYIDIEIDKLTNSIEKVITGEGFQTDISLVGNKELQTVTKKSGWLFNWKAEFKQPDRDVYKLAILDSPELIQGLISLSEREDHVYMHLIESAPFNLGKDKVYLGIPGNLVAFACRIAFHRGFEGYISFTAKTILLDHYRDTLGAIHIGSNLMVRNTEAALRLIDKYFNN